MKGKLVVIEGGDGAGKGTQIAMLEKYFGNKIYVTREPGGSVFAEKIRSLVLDDPDSKDTDGKTHFSLMWASRADHMNKIVIPTLNKGVHVICDRFDSSTFAYNIRAQNCPELEELFWATRKVFLNDNIPDLYIYLDIDPEIGRQRQIDAGQKTNHFDEKPKEFKYKMREGMLEFFKTKGIPHVIIDATLSRREIYKKIHSAVMEATD